MDLDSTTNTLDQASEITTKIVKTILFSLISLLLLGILFWVIFYSEIAANIKVVKTARAYFQTAAWNIEALYKTKNSTFPPFDPIYTIQATNDTSLNTNYLLWGHFYDINFLSDSALITIKGIDGQLYTFVIPNYNPTVLDGKLQFTILYIPNTTANNYLDYVAPSSIDATENYFGGNIIQIAWQDDRNLSQIVTNYQKDMNIPINIKNSASIKIIVFN